MPKILSPADFATQLKAGESEFAFRDASGNVAAKLVGISASASVNDGEAERAVDFVISTGALDRYNSTIAPQGWKIANFNANPVVLWAHDDSIPAIARAENTRIDGNRVRSRAIFATREIHPLADTVYGLIKNKFINAASVGWIPLKWQYVEEEGRGFGVDYLEQELLEWSAVNIPANHECLAEARSIGIDTKPLLAWAERALDQGGMLMIPRIELEALRKSAGAATVSRPAVVTRESATDADKEFARRVDNLKAVFQDGSISIDLFTDSLLRMASTQNVRAGRVLSGENEDALRAAHEHCNAALENCMAAIDHCKQACDHVKGVVDQNNKDPDDDNDQDPAHDTGDNDDDDNSNAVDQGAQEIRGRRVRLLKLSASPLAIAAGTKH